ncbi:hypothetical protein O6H91_12G103700 [Diphasiastrum complanatum]|uniref:Uncharacterized protein n=1 Tax=Diphasiastrum complanatum TaxID=34168 RepID=A0ACC2C5D7_DIPCM|nr:hypothetical protein O6H91_12G103700 [Diphasiastrum complanatum]
MMARFSSMSGLSSVMRDHKLSSGAANRRDKILGVSVSSVGILMPSVDSSHEMNDLREEDVWGEEVRTGLEDEDDKKRDGYGLDYVGKLSVDLSKVIGSNRRWLIRDNDSFGDMGVARGLSLLSQLDRGVGVSLGQDSKPGRMSTALRMIPLSQSVQSNEAGRQIRQQSAPVDVPDWSKILGADKKSNGSIMRQPVAEDDDEDEERLPPHELLAREYEKTQRTTFSVFEGVGRTLKGRDLSRVRNAVLRRTGFLDL